MVDRHINILLYKHMHVCVAVGNINKALKKTGRERVRGGEDAVVYSLSRFLWEKRVWTFTLIYLTYEEQKSDSSQTEKVLST